MLGQNVVPRLPKVAILLSTYNGDAYLQPQLESLRSQQEVQVSLHVRDDGSTDGTCAILRQYAEVWPELADVPSGPNLGPAGSFLDLLRTAPSDADYYAFCDQDDVWLPDKLARAAGALAGETGPAVYCSNVTCVSKDLKVMGVSATPHDVSFQQMLFGNFATGCTVVLNPEARALINSRQPRQGVMMHDWWCVLVIAAMGNVYYDAEPRILYRQHGANAIGLDTNWAAQKVKQALRLLRKRGAYYPIHTQAKELLRLYGSQMPDFNRVRLDRLVKSKHSLLARISYALSGEIAHRRMVEAAAVRGLIFVGWY